MKYTPPKREKDNWENDPNYDVVAIPLHELNQDWYDYTKTQGKLIQIHTAPENRIQVPILEDYKIGYYSRYIVQRRNNNAQLYEIDHPQLDTYGSNKGIDQLLYELFEIKWSLTDPNINSSTIFSYKDIIPNLGTIFKFPNQFISTIYFMQSEA